MICFESSLTKSSLVVIMTLWCSSCVHLVITMFSDNSRMQDKVNRPLYYKNFLKTWGRRKVSSIIVFFLLLLFLLLLLFFHWYCDIDWWAHFKTTWCNPIPIYLHLSPMKTLKLQHKIELNQEFFKHWDSCLEQN